MSGSIGQWGCETGGISYSGNEQTALVAGGENHDDLRARSPLTHIGTARCTELYLSKFTINTRCRQRCMRTVAVVPPSAASHACSPSGSSSSMASHSSTMGPKPSPGSNRRVVPLCAPTRQIACRVWIMGGLQAGEIGRLRRDDFNRVPDVRQGVYLRWVRGLELPVARPSVQLQRRSSEPDGA